MKRAIFGPGTDEFEVAYTFCVDSGGRCFDPAEDVGDEPCGPNLEDDSGPDPA